MYCDVVRQAYIEARHRVVLALVTVVCRIDQTINRNPKANA